MGIYVYAFLHMGKIQEKLQYVMYNWTFNWCTTDKMRCFFSKYSISISVLPMCMRFAGRSGIVKVGMTGDIRTLTGSVNIISHAMRGNSWDTIHAPLDLYLILPYKLVTTSPTLVRHVESIQIWLQVHWNYLGDLFYQLMTNVWIIHD